MVKMPMPYSVLNLKYMTLFVIGESLERNLGYFSTHSVCFCSTHANAQYFSLTCIFVGAGDPDHQQTP